MNGELDKPDFERDLREFEQRLERVRRKVSQAELDLDGLVLDFRELRVRADFNSGVTIVRSKGNSSQGSETRRYVKSAVPAIEPKAFTLTKKERFDGSAAFQIDDGKVFTLPPLLAELLSILSKDNGRSPDNLVGWKNHKEIAELLSKKIGRTLSKRAVIQATYRLRQELFLRGGLPRTMIQTNRSVGVPFAIRNSGISGIGFVGTLSPPGLFAELGNEGTQ